MLECGSVVMLGGMQEQMAKEGQDIMLLCRLVLPGGNDGPICLRKGDHAWSTSMHCASSTEVLVCILDGGAFRMSSLMLV